MNPSTQSSAASSALTPLRGVVGVLLLCVFTAATGYGVFVPVLPLFLAEIGAEASLARHTGLLSGVYSLAMFVAAPLWGRAVDRYGARAVITLALAGNLLGIAFFGVGGDLRVAYGSRILAGLFAAGVMPAALAVLGVGTDADRARRFAMTGGASVAGFLVGPAIGSWLVGPVMGMQSAQMPGMLALPMLAVAVLGLPVVVAALRWVPSALARSGEATPAVRKTDLLPFVALSGASAFALGTFEIGLTVIGRETLRMTIPQVTYMFVECTLLMLATQVALATRWGSSLLRPATLGGAALALAVALLLLPGVSRVDALRGLLVILAVGTGLIPAVLGLVAARVFDRRGTAMGTIAAAGSLAQALASGLTGLLYAAAPAGPFWLAAGIVALATTQVSRVFAVGPRAGCEERPT